VPPGGPNVLSDVEVVVDEPPLSPQALDAVDGVLTGCALAIAETGTIVLDGGERSGRRALTLVPDWHMCIVEASSVVTGVPDAVAILAEAAREGRPITLVSGPSATSDIELDRVEGVHGPRTLDVLVLE
jgi:L-lactate dehydrogenase complex protein LldG